MTADLLEEMPYSLKQQLYDAYMSLNEACLSVQDAVRADAGEYQVYVPGHPANSTSAREAAIRSMTLMYMDEGGNTVPSGLLCASESTLDTINNLNLAKAELKRTVLAIREFQANSDMPASRIGKLIRDEVTIRGYRTEELKAAMQDTGISSLDLKRCYAQIRILPAHLRKVSWTWATTHSRIKAISVTEAIAMAKNLPNTEAAEVALDLLNRCRVGERLVKKVPLNNQLRVNIVFDEAGETMRKAYPVSGIVVANQRELPKVRWRDDPGERQKPSPYGTTIESEAFIKALDLYRYAQ